MRDEVRYAVGLDATVDRLMAIARAEGYAAAKEEGLMSYGEKAVGLDFNPSGDETVKRLKELYAEIIDICNESRGGNGERLRLWSIAITEAQGAQMWAVKAATWRDLAEKGGGND